MANKKHPLLKFLRREKYFRNLGVTGSLGRGTRLTSKSELIEMRAQALSSLRGYEDMPHRQLVTPADSVQSQEPIYSVESPRIVLPTLNEVNDTIIRFLARHPYEMYRLRSRVFEELIAEILDKRGWNVELTGRSADNGIDLVAFSAKHSIPLKLIIQCKRYAPEKRVGLSIVKELYATKLDLGASLAMLVTTSWFTRPSIAFANRHRFELDLKDFDALLFWLKGHPKA